MHGFPFASFAPLREIPVLEIQKQSNTMPAKNAEGTNEKTKRHVSRKGAKDAKETITTRFALKQS